MKKVVLLAAAFATAVQTCYAAPPEPLSQGSLPEPAAMRSWSVLPDNGQEWQEVDDAEAGLGAGLTGPEHFALAEDSYEMGDYERAGEHYRRALELLDDDARLARSHEMLAFIHAAFGETEMAYEEFLRALALDRAITLDPDLVSPKVYEAFTRARDELVREGTLVVNCDPPGAEVLLNGEPIGEAPVRKERLPAGVYTLTLMMPGYETDEETVEIKKDVTLTVDEKLARAEGSLCITSVPPGVQVVLDGRPAGTTPVTLENVSGGRHAVTLKRDYFEPFAAEIVMEKGESAALSAEIKRRVLVVVPDAGGAQVTLGIAHGPLSEAIGVSLVFAGLPELEARLRGRGLDAGMLGRLTGRRTELTLEDAAMLSGIMEESRVELALVVVPREVEDEYELGLALYSTASLLGDSVTLRCKDAGEAAARFGEFLAGWRGISDPYRPSFGMRLADRASGGVEVVSVVPAHSAATAGLQPGDIIGSVDGEEAGSKDAFRLLTAVPGAHEVAYTRRGKQGRAELAAGSYPLETPLDAGGYLYNLALVQFEGYVKSVPVPAEGVVDDTRGATALNLGNVYYRMGECARAVEMYGQARMSAPSGICTGTALFRMGGAYERLGWWPEAAYAYRRAVMLYPDATVGSVDGPPVRPLALARMKALFEMGLTKERWWE